MFSMAGSIPAAGRVSVWPNPTGRIGQTLTRSATILSSAPSCGTGPTIGRPKGDGAPPFGGAPPSVARAVSRILFRRADFRRAAGAAISLPALRRDPSFPVVRLIPGAFARAAQAPALSCTARGFSCPRCRHRGGGLLPRHFTLSRPKAAGVFSVTLSVAAGLRRRRPVFRRARCSMVSGLSSRGALAGAASGRRTLATDNLGGKWGDVKTGRAGQSPTASPGFRARSAGAFGYGDVRDRAWMISISPGWVTLRLGSGHGTTLTRCPKCSATAVSSVASCPPSIQRR